MTKGTGIDDLSALENRLASFSLSPVPTWISNTQPPFNILWTNEPGLELWDASDVQELRERDFNITESTVAQLRDWCEQLQSGARPYFEMDWTLYPKGVPRRVRIFLSGFDGAPHGLGFLLLQQAFPLPEPVDPAILRGAESVRHINVGVASLSLTGEVLSRNRALLQAFGEAPLREWFEEPGAVEAILAVGEHRRTHRAQLSSRLSRQLRTYALEALWTIDPVTGKHAILVHLLDETARLGAERDARQKGELITDLERALETVEAQKQRWRALIDSAPDLVMILDRQHRVRACNRPALLEAAAKALGVDPSAGPEDAPPPIPVEELFAVESRQNLAMAIAVTLETGQMSECEAIMPAFPGLGRAARARTHVLRFGAIAHASEDARPPAASHDHVIMMSSDITERRDLEQQLLHSQKIQAIGTLAGGVAHDFNNLLTIITGSTELARLDLEDGLDVGPSLDEIEAAAARASRLTRQLLAFGRKQVLQPVAVELNALVRELAQLLTRVLGEHIHLQLALSEHPCWLLADPGQLEQVVMNLAINARDAMPGGGTLTLTTSWTDPPEFEVLLEVADTGTGMTPEVAARIFDPFFTTKAMGTGLGLATLHGIVTQSGGSVQVQTAPGEGSRFLVRLPRLLDPEAEAQGHLASAGEATVPGGDERVLLVEDEDAVRRTLTRTLGQLGYRVVAAADPEEAAQRAAALERLDLLVSDVVLAQGTGPMVRDAVLAIHPRAKVLFITGYTDDARVREGAEAGHEHLLQKPFTREQLAYKLRAVLEG
ncbi:multi-sensor hybrid histidine kinase [Plesiocystis pacifica SIR-1]|uniref:histidine kinase n=1 Tax=Plesiocystis pacifica SIR-1 TaxID=391625 RepID=A6G9D4_9BACT|nr:ATP-binding protein [Plesiocystis pacifica]EDM77556.1 multi-sensor hybrid histidine kinase [Plesiocystis pacifica SIR-1]